MVRRGWRLSACVGFGLLVMVGCDERAPARACGALAGKPVPHPNVVLVVNDTMRRDSVGAYGGSASTPAFDRFARRHLRFVAATTEAPWTKPAIATLFTSLYPSQHRLRTHPELPDDHEESEAGSSRVDVEILPGELVTLAESLAASGYRTAAFVGNPWMSKRFGFAQGFQHYDDSFADWDAPGERLSDAALKWIADVEATRPYFLYVHYMDSHRPYAELDRWEVFERLESLQAHPVTDERIADSIADLVRLDGGYSAGEAGLDGSLELLSFAYDRGVERFDRALGRLLNGLEKLPAYERTAILITSDHGESLFERGFDNHGNGLYEEELAIPMAARLPGLGGPGGVVSCPVGLIDIYPTLCDYLSVPCPETLYGTNWLGPRIGDPEADRPRVSEGVMFRPQNRALRVGNLKLLYQPEPSPDGVGHRLFDLAADPGEAHDLSTTPDYRAVFQAMTVSVRTAVPEAQAIDALEVDRVPLTLEEQERLRSLGYVE